MTRTVLKQTQYFFNWTTFLGWTAGGLRYLRFQLEVFLFFQKPIIDGCRYDAGRWDGLFHFEKSGRWPFRHPWVFLVKRRACTSRDGFGAWNDHCFQELVWEETPNHSKNNNFLRVFPSTRSSWEHGCSLHPCCSGLKALSLKHDT